MLYAFDISTPANTTTPRKTALKMEAGTIIGAEIVFPPGPVHLLQLKICDALHQLWPVNTDAYFAGDNDWISITEDYDLTQPPFELQAYTINEDDTFPHRVIIRITLKAQGGVAPPVVGGEVTVPEEFL